MLQLQEVETILQKQRDAAAAAEAALYAHNPDEAYWQPRSALPPNPALVQAQKTWAETSKAFKSSYPPTAAAGGGVKGTARHSSSVEDLAANGFLQGTFSYRTGGPHGTSSAGSSNKQLLRCC
jgi:hypothetical protein